MGNNKGQNTAEYAILIGLVVAAAIAMQTYVKRGVQGRFADEVDDMAAQTSELGTTKQYEPYYLDSSYTSTVVKDEMTQAGAASAPKTGIDREVTQSGTQTLLKSETNTN